jgi:hypothetical protein
VSGLSLSLLSALRSRREIEQEKTLGREERERGEKELLERAREAM